MADTRTVCAFYVVGIDLELWFAVYRRAFGKQQVLIALTCISLLGVFANDDASVENRRRLIVENALVKLAAAAVWLDMIDYCVIIDMLVNCRNVETVEGAISAVAVECNINIVAYERASK